MFIAIESLRQSYDELVSYLPGWLGRVVLFVGCVCVEFLRLLWTMCGVFQEWVEQFVDLQLRFEDNHVKVGCKWRDHEDLPDT